MKKLTDARVRCNTCRWAMQHRFRQGQGVCRMYQNQDGELYNLNYAQTSSVAVDPIEKKTALSLFPR